jgi:hypothetical protein
LETDLSALLENFQTDQNTLGDLQNRGMNITSMVLRADDGQA